jgi:hypothetical protein
VDLGERAGITIGIPEGTTGDLRLVVTATHLLSGPSLSSSSFGIAVNGQTIFETIERRSGLVSYEITIPQSAYDANGCIVLEFLAELHSPAELGMGQDSRRLGLGLVSLCLEAPPAS